MVLLNQTSDVQHVAGLAGLIKQYGMEVIIVAVFIMLFVLLFRSIISNNNKMYDRITVMQDEMTKTLKELIKEAADKQQKTENVLEIFIKLDSAMKDILTHSKLRLDCERLSVYAFHNGTRASHGFPFFKVSCISEQIKVASKTKPVLKEQVAIPLAVFDNSLYQLYDHGYLIIKDIAEIREEFPALFSMLKNNTIKSMVMVAIYNSKNEILGVAMAEYANELVDDNMVDFIRNELVEVAIKLAPIMEYSNYQDKV
ncbi:MAG: hypothetical protein IJ889_00975 [Eubacterium sp.]|nr:hypothetical protein [Eubacterium sp.]MBR2247363.1 hypothetical protein [Bacilli bacterium]